MIVDSHCHLDRLDLESCGGSIDSALDFARSQGVSHFLSVGISLESLPAMLEITDAHQDVYATAGSHPLEDTGECIDIGLLESWARDSRIVAVGETGLDYHYAPEKKQQQQENFIGHLQVAEQVEKPIIVHTRSAKEDTLSCIRQYPVTAGGVLHCFTEDWDMASRALDLGFYISISGIVTFNNASSLREVVKKIPPDRLLVETDSPYLAPVPYRGKANQPAYVRQVTEYVANLRGVSMRQLAEQTSNNFFTLFRLNDHL